MQAFQVRIKPSLRGTVWVAALHSYAFFLCVTVFYGAMRWGGLAAVALSLAWAWRIQRLRSEESVRLIEVDTGGRATLAFPNRPPQPACLSESSLVHRRGCFLTWRTEGRIVRHVVLPDMADAESYRRLTVWARFGRSKEDTGLS